MAQVGEGRLVSLVVVAAMLAGTWLGKRARGSMGIDSGSCA